MCNTGAATANAKYLISLCRLLGRPVPENRSRWPAARTARNPSTGATFQVAATKKIVFQAAKALKGAVAG